MDAVEKLLADVDDMHSGRVPSDRQPPPPQKRSIKVLHLLAVEYATHQAWRE